MTRKNVTLSLDVEVWEKAKVSKINMSECAENGLRHEIARLGGDIKTIDEIRVEQEIKEKAEAAKQAAYDLKIAKAKAEGRMVVDENSPDLIPMNKFQRKGGRFVPDG